MNNRTCPGCGEKNPLAAVVCWACCTDLAPLSAVWKAAARLGIGPYTQLRRESRRESGRDPIERIFATIINYAVQDGATDIHIEPLENGVSILYRLNGELHEQMKVPEFILSPLVSHIRRMGRMDAEPAQAESLSGDEQSGRIHFVGQGRPSDWDVSTRKGPLGARVVLSAR
jgi:type II secretory ATPase GspE/PulE/Tfp pilus assembly ATPase PilB-like protein